MIRPEHWDEIEAADDTDRRPAPVPGVYVCKIVDVEDTKSKAGRSMLKIKLDIAEGEHKDFFKDDFDYWKDRGTEGFWKLETYQLYDADSLRFFKRFVRNVELSNDHFIFDFNEKRLIGKLVGMMLDAREYKNSNGIRRLALRAGRSYTAGQVRQGVKTEPKVHTLDERKIALSEYIAEREEADRYEFEHVDDADIPF